MRENRFDKKIERIIEDLGERIDGLELERKDLLYRLRFEELITTISSTFINLPSAAIDEEIERALEVVGEMTGADRMYIFRYDEDRQTMDNTHEWRAAGQEPFKDRLRKIPLEWAAWLVDQINASRIVYIPRLEDLPPEASKLKRLNIEQGTKSSLIIPLQYKGKTTGMFGLDSTRRHMTWSPEVVTLLRVLGEIFSNALERKHAEEALRQSEEKYRTILETMEESYWEVDLKGNLVFFNNALSRLLGYEYEELAGINYRVYTSPEDKERIAHSFNKIYRTGIGVMADNYTFIDRHGRPVAVETSTYPIEDDSGDVVGFRGVSRNVTDRQKAIEALKESEKKYRTALEASPDPLVVYDMEGRVVYLNPAFEEVFGWSLEELHGLVMENFIPKDRREEARSMAQRMVDGKPFSGIETERLTRSGGRIPVSISGAGYRNGDETPRGGIITFRDIREQKRLENQLLNIQKLESIGTLAGGIAHDFNNLLMAIQGNVSLALYNLPEGHPHYRYLENIQKSVASGSRLTRQLLGFARKGRYEVKKIDLNRLVRQVAGVFERTRKEIIIHSDFAPDLYTVEADEGQLEQVLLNIFLNAAQAMEGGGDLYLETKNQIIEEDRFIDLAPGAYVQLSIRDTGVGMDKRTLGHLFEPFFTSREMGRGTGLGLASTYGIVKGHGGHIEAHSILGKGSTFNIYLPAASGTETTKEDSPERIERGNMETVLFVDDEEMVLEAGSLMLQKLGYDVLKARNGKEAVALFEKHKEEIDLVILDMIMPAMGGGEVFNRIREINPRVPVLLSSGYSIDGQAREIMDRGCDGFIQKPFTIETLSKSIRVILDRTAPDFR